MRALLALATVLATGSGCGSAVGTYFANRARDFGECWRVECRVGPGLGVGIRGGGLIDVGLLASAGLHGAGCVYGAGGVYSPLIPHTPGFFDAIAPGWSLRHVDVVQLSVGVPSSLWTWRIGKSGRRWIWAGEDRAWARVHAFDVEVCAHAVIVGAVVGFSPGEFVDFLLGWFGLDIAGDDRQPEPGS